MDQDNFLEILFDQNRIGFSKIAEQIIAFLDFHSLVHFKRSAKFVLNFLRSTGLEKVKYNAKLTQDWRSGHARATKFNTNGTNPLYAKFFAHERKFLCSLGHRIYKFDVPSGSEELIFTGHKSLVTCMEVIDDAFLISGGYDGTLFVWDLVTADILDERQLFGRLSLIKYGNGFLVTGHFSSPRSGDVGCVTIRRFDGPKSMPVVFSMFDELMPVVTLDFNLKSNLISILEWKGTYEGVESGIVSVYHFLTKDYVGGLTDHVHVNFTSCQFHEDKYLITGDQDYKIRIWSITAGEGIECLRTLSLHQNVIMGLQVKNGRALSRDVKGLTIVWEIPTLDERDRPDDLPIVLNTTKSVMFGYLHAMALGDRQFLVGHADDCINLNDYWT